MLLGVVVIARTPNSVSTDDSGGRMRRDKCEARQYSDQMCCTKCGLNWDVNDEDPPACKTEAEFDLKKLRRKVAAQKTLANIRKTLGMG